jgi:NAD(P)-dependent dehydrogenase (short-subunit alcohol dehydrogenase family)
MPTLEGQVALITGAGRGIGRGIALRLAALKATIVLAARNEDRLNAVAKEIERAGGEAFVVPVELEDTQSIKALAQTVRDRFGRLDILVNNAGITHSALLEETATEDYDRLIRVNARAPFILCRETLDLLRNAPVGRIINIASVVGVKGYPRQSAYTASKHALRGMSIALAEELRGTNVRVHVLCPGGVDTDMVGDVRPDIRKDDLIRPDEIAELVEYLVTHNGSAVIDELRIRRGTAAPWF